MLHRSRLSPYPNNKAIDCVLMLHMLHRSRSSWKVILTIKPQTVLKFIQYHATQINVFPESYPNNKTTGCALILYMLHGLRSSWNVIRIIKPKTVSSHLDMLLRSRPSPYPNNKAIDCVLISHMLLRSRSS